MNKEKKLDLGKLTDIAQNNLDVKDNAPESKLPLDEIFKEKELTLFQKKISELHNFLNKQKEYFAKVAARQAYQIKDQLAKLEKEIAKYNSTLESLDNRREITKWKYEALKKREYFLLFQQALKAQSQEIVFEDKCFNFRNLEDKEIELPIASAGILLIQDPVMIGLMINIIQAVGQRDPNMFLRIVRRVVHHEWLATVKKEEFLTKDSLAGCLLSDALHDYLPTPPDHWSERFPELQSLHKKLIFYFVMNLDSSEMGLKAEQKIEKLFLGKGFNKFPTSKKFLEEMSRWLASSNQNDSKRVETNRGLFLSYFEALLRIDDVRKLCGLLFGEQNVTGDYFSSVENALGLESGAYQSFKIEKELQLNIIEDESNNVQNTINQSLLKNIKEIIKGMGWAETNIFYCQLSYIVQNYDKLLKGDNAYPAEDLRSLVKWLWARIHIHQFLRGLSFLPKDIKPTLQESSASSPKVEGIFKRVKTLEAQLMSYQYGEIKSNGFIEEAKRIKTEIGKLKMGSPFSSFICQNLQLTSIAAKLSAVITAKIKTEPTLQHQLALLPMTEQEQSFLAAQSYSQLPAVGQSGSRTPPRSGRNGEGIALLEAKPLRKGSNPSPLPSPRHG